MAFLKTLKRGITGFNEQDELEMEKARTEAKEKEHELKEAQHRARLNKKLEAIRNAPAIRRQRAQQLKAKAGAAVKSAYTGLQKMGQKQQGGMGNLGSSFGGFGNAQQSFSTKKTKPTKRPNQDPFTPLANFNNIRW
jgi:Sec-independent protein translocase protein TatA